MEESITCMDAELLCLVLVICYSFHTSYNPLLHGLLFYRRSKALGRYCVKRLTSRCTVVIIEHGEIILNKKGEFVEEDTTSMISLQSLQVHLFYASWFYFMLVQFLQQKRLFSCRKNCSVDPLSIRSWSLSIRVGPMPRNKSSCCLLFLPLHSHQPNFNL